MTTTRQAEELDRLNPDALERAAELIEQGEAVVIPTETIYGLTAAADQPIAVRGVFELKQRALDKPSAIFLAEVSEIDNYATAISAIARRVLNELLPGPLTVVLQAQSADWPGVVGPDGKIGIRISAEPFVCRLVERCNAPLLATSAGITGGGDLSSLAEVRESLSRQVPLIVYNNEMRTGTASTVVDLCGAKPRILRQGKLRLPDWCRSGEES
ncbi:MAG: L-threonylcarbamoyladenylate synthase [bacterium]